MSLATREHLASFHFSHSQDMLKLHEMVELSLFFLSQAALFLSLDQLGDPLLSLGRGLISRNRFRSCARCDELNDLEICGVAVLIFSSSYDNRFRNDGEGTMNAWDKSEN